MPRKIKDLPPGTSLGGIAFKHPQTGATCYWRSQWSLGIWYNQVPDRATQVYPLFLEKLTDALELELVEEPDNSQKTPDGKTHEN